MYGLPLIACSDGNREVSGERQGEMREFGASGLGYAHAQSLSVRTFRFFRTALRGIECASSGQRETNSWLTLDVGKEFRACKARRTYRSGTWLGIQDDLASPRVRLALANPAVSEVAQAEKVSGVFSSLFKVTDDRALSLLKRFARVPRLSEFSREVFRC